MNMTCTLVLLGLLASTVALASAPKAVYVDCLQRVPQSILDSLTEYNTTLPASLPASLKCGYVAVPVDYSKPLTSTNSLNVSFSINAINSTRGVLLYNPGGPGEESQGLAWGIAGVPLDDLSYVAGLEGFDFLSIDTRGIGYTNPIVCGPLNFSAPLNILSSSEYEAFGNNITAYVNDCADRTSPKDFLDHVGSDNIARDYESVRMALGYEKINYLGYSYGTIVGREYLAQFPQSAGRFILDAITTRNQTTLEGTRNERISLDRLIQRADAYCQHNTTACANISVPAAFAQVYNHPNVRGLTRFLFLGGTPKFEAFSQALALAVTGNYSGFDDTRDFQALISSALINNAGPTICADMHSNNKTYAAYRQLMRDVGVGAQYGNWTVDGLLVAMCNFWPAAKSRLSYRTWTQPALLVTADFDGNTPTEDSDLVRSRMPNATMLVRHGDDHGSFMVNGPVRDAMLAYLYNGTIPGPFDGEVYSVYAPGQIRTKIVDPYVAPVGTIAGDIEAGGVFPA